MEEGKISILLDVLYCQCTSSFGAGMRGAGGWDRALGCTRTLVYSTPRKLVDAEDVVVVGPGAILVGAFAGIAMYIPVSMMDAVSEAILANRCRWACLARL